MRTFRHLLSTVFLSALCVAAALAATEAKKTYAIPAGDAAAALKQFSATSGRETLFAAEAVRGVKTPAVRGELTAREAIDALLAETGLVVTVDEKTGAFAVRRENPIESKNGRSRRADATTALRFDRTDYGLRAEMIRLEDFLVQGLRAPGQVNEGVIPRKANGAIAFQVFDRSSIENSGANSLGEFFRSYSGNTSNGLGFQAAFGNATNLSNGPGDSSDRINLRGLGNNRTVVLLNGRRLYGSDSSGPDISRIPLNAVERVEILSGAGAAIYGANAVGGAVNIITRRNYSQTDITGYLGTSTGGGATEWRGTVYSGFSLNEGRTTGTLLLEHTKRGELRAGQREFYRDALNVVPPTSSLYRTILTNPIRGPRALVSTTATSGLLIPGNLTATVASVPVGYSSSNAVPADFASTAGQIPLYFDRSAAVLLQPKSTIDSANFQGEHRFIKDRLEVYTELAWRYQQARNRLPGIGGTASLTAASPYNPFRADAAAGRPVGVAVSVQWDPVDVPLDDSFTLQRTVRAVGGVKGKLGVAKKWGWAADYSYDRNEGYSTYLQRASSLNDAVTAGIYNPFRDLSVAPNTIDLAQLTATNIARNIPEIYVGNLRVSGELVEWAAGPIGLSFGVERRDEEIKTLSVVDFSPIRRQVNPTAVALLSPSSNGQSKASRQSNAAYAELSVPVLGRDRKLLLVDALEFSLAARHEAYGDYAYRSTFGSGVLSAAQPSDVKATPFTAGVLWRPVRDVSLRASYAETFVSPTMTQFFNARSTFPSSSPTTFFDPVLNATVTRPTGSVTVTSGGNPNLLPEFGRAYNYGVILTPRWVSGLTVSADLFHIVSYNQIRTPSVQTVISFYPERVTRDSSNNVTAYDTSSVNMSQVVVGGADMRIDWQFPISGVGVLNWQAGATYTDYYKQLAIIGGPFLSGVGDRTLDLGAPQRWKGNTSLTLTRDAWTVGLAARYVGKYKDLFNSGLAVPNANGGVDGEFIRSQTEFDVRVAYEFGEQNAGWRRWMKSTRVTLGALNVLDRRPPYVSSNTGGAFYSYYSDPRMRFIYLEVRKRL